MRPLKKLEIEKQMEPIFEEKAPVYITALENLDSFFRTLK
jgi:hypothetical protein